jgi:hypothetical protein
LPVGLLLASWSLTQLDKFSYRDSSPTIRFGAKTTRTTRVSDGDSAEMAMYEVIRLSCSVAGYIVSYLIGLAPWVFVQWVDFTFGDGSMNQILTLRMIVFYQMKQSLSRLANVFLCLLA